MRFYWAKLKRTIRFISDVHSISIGHLFFEIFFYFLLFLVLNASCSEQHSIANAIQKQNAIVIYMRARGGGVGCLVVRVFCVFRFSSPQIGAGRLK